MILIIFYYLVSKGKAIFMLRKSAKLNSKRKPAKRFSIMTDDFMKHPMLKSDQANLEEDKQEEQ